MRASPPPRPYASAPDAAPPAWHMPRWLIVVLSLVAFGVLGVESSVDLARAPVWHEAVVAIDLGLVVAYSAWMVLGVWRARRSLLAWVIQQRVALLLWLLVIVSLPVPRVAGGIIIGKFFGWLALRTVDSRLGRQIVGLVNLRPSQTLALSFVAMIAVASVLLTFPAATVDGKGTPLLDAVFTMTSAICVTGLAIRDTGSFFSPFGQAVILAGIQLGAIGIMVLSAAFAVLVGGRLPSRQQAGLGQLLDVGSAEGLKQLVISVTTATVLTELAGATLLFFAWMSDLPNWSERLWWSIFHSVSAFCNAGFALSSDSLSRWVSSPGVNLIFIMLITAGSLGFATIHDLTYTLGLKRPSLGAFWKHLQVQTRIILIGTLFLHVFGMLFFLFFEYDGALSGLDVPSKIVASAFQGVTLRTAGFNTVPLAGLAAPTIVFCLVWMFIGSAPGSTGGGVKVTTAVVVGLAVRAMLRGRDDVEVMGRTIPRIIVYRSISIVFIGAGLITVFLMALSATQPLAFEKLMFEVVSAFATVGLSMDLTGELNTAGRLMIIALMYVGRVGPLTLALAIGERSAGRGYRYPDGRIAVG